MIDELKERRLQKQIDKLDPFVKSACHAFGIDLKDYVQGKIDSLAIQKKELLKILKQPEKNFTNNDESYLFKCIDGSKRGVDLAATKYLNEIGMVNEKPFQYLSNLYSLNTQNTKAVTITVS